MLDEVLCCMSITGLGLSLSNMGIKRPARDRRYMKGFQERHYMEGKLLPRRSSLYGDKTRSVPAHQNSGDGARSIVLDGNQTPIGVFAV